MSNEPTPAQKPPQTTPPQETTTEKRTTERTEQERKTSKDRRRREEGPGVPAEDMDFDQDEDQHTVATQVGSVGWPEGAENEEGTGPGADEPQ